MTKGKRKAMQRSTRNNGGLQWLGNCYTTSKSPFFAGTFARPSQVNEMYRVESRVARFIGLSLAAMQGMFRRKQNAS